MTSVDQTLLNTNLLFGKTRLSADNHKNCEGKNNIAVNCGK